MVIYFYIGHIVDVFQKNKHTSENDTIYTIILALDRTDNICTLNNNGNNILHNLCIATDIGSESYIFCNEMIVMIMLLYGQRYIYLL